LILQVLRRLVGHFVRAVDEAFDERAEKRSTNGRLLFDKQWKQRKTLQRRCIERVDKQENQDRQNFYARGGDGF
jgi:hypothetical protein